MLGLIIPERHAYATAWSQQSELFELNKTHKAKRADIVPEFPFGQATLRGFQTMSPPHENPAHWFARGAVILIIASYGSVTFLGRATPKVIPESGSE
jgi:hypothetical protein